jgi:peptidoglycan/LPS O-acetylase OafA/YrhL
VNKRFEEIDRLRGMAILFVVLHHWPGVANLLGTPWLAAAWTGVDLFFVISGYVVTLSFLKEPISKESISTFYLRRFFRIIPLAAVWVALPYFSQSYMNSSGIFSVPPDRLQEFTTIATLSFNYWVSNQPSYLYFYWSLIVEEHFYLILPWILLAIPNTKARLVATAGLIFSIAFLVRPFSNEVASQNWMAVRFYSHLRFDSIFWGVLLALMSREHMLPALPKHKYFDRLAMGFVAISIALFFLIPFKLPLKYSHGVGFVILAMLSCGLVYLASQERGYIFGLPYVGSTLTYIGKRSFGIYLCHDWAMRINIEAVTYWTQGAFNTYLSGWAPIITTTLICLLAAELSYRLIEIPGMRFGAKVVGIFKQESNVAVPQVATSASDSKIAS